jgi:hypothetical protein
MVLDKLKMEVKELERAVEALRTPEQRFGGNSELAQLRHQRQEEIRLIKAVMNRMHLIYALFVMAGFLWWLALNGFLFGWVSAWTAAAITTLVLTGIVFAGLLLVAMLLVDSVRDLFVSLAWRKHRDKLVALVESRRIV